MKKTLIHLASLQVAAAMAAKSTETLVSLDRKPVHIQADKKPRYIKKIRGHGDRKPVHIQADKPVHIQADKRPIHINSGCSDIDYTIVLAIPTSRSPEGITKMHPAQFAPQHHAPVHAMSLA